MNREMNKRVARRAAAVGLIGAIMLASGCTDVSGPSEGWPAEVTITPQEVTVASIGETVTFEARALDRRGRAMSGVTVAWEVSDSTVLEPVEPGVFRSVALGTATVRARVIGMAGVDPDGFHSGRAANGSAIVQIDQQPWGIRLDTERLRLWSIGQVYQLEAEVVDARGTPMLEPPTIEWALETGGAGAVTVDGTGLVRAAANGVSRVVASAGNVSATTDVEVAASVRFEACVAFVQEGGGNGAGSCATIETTVRDRDGLAPGAVTASARAEQR